MYFILLSILASVNGHPEVACGRRLTVSHHRIATAVAADELPWMVSIQKEMSDGRWVHKCAGTIIRPDAVLTVATCLVDIDARRKPIRLVAGCQHLDDMGSCEKQVRLVKTIEQYHKEYNMEYYNLGVTIVKLIRPWTFTNHVSPICLPKANSQYHGMAMIAGWWPLYRNALYALDVNILSVEKCGDSHILEDDRLCGGYVLGGVSCGWFPGEPLMVTVGNVMYQIGVAEGDPISLDKHDKYRARCPRAFFKVSMFQKWISRYVERMPEQKTEVSIPKVTCGPDIRQRRLSSNQEDYRIINGNYSEHDQFPWMVSLQFWNEGYFFEKGRWEHWCGGTIISRHLVLSAAHCISIFNESSSSFRMIAGCRWYRDPHQGCQVRDLVSTNIVIHPDYKTGHYRADIMIFRVDEPWIFNSHSTGRAVWPICLPKLEKFIQGMVAAAGWGLIKWRSKLEQVAVGISNPSPLLKTIDLAISDNCETNRIENICASPIPDVGDSSGICSGDSGGPLMVKKGHQVYLIGVASSSPEKCGPFNDGYFVRVAHYRKWIDDNGYSGPD